MKKTLLLLLSLAMAQTASFAQDLHVSSFKVNPKDKTAQESPVMDLGGNPCSLIRVEIDDAKAQFSGDIVGKPVYNNGEYQIWVIDGTQRLDIASEKALPLTVEFSDYGIDNVVEKKVYVLSLAIPKKGEEQGMVNVDYFPYGAVVFLDDEKVGTTPCTLKELKLGKHEIRIWAKGFDVAEEKVKLTSETPINLNGSLHKKYKGSGTFTYLEPVYRKEKKNVTKDGKTETKINYKKTGEKKVEKEEIINLLFAFVDPSFYGKDTPIYGISPKCVTNKLWRIIMGSAASSQADQSSDELIDIFVQDSKIDVTRADANAFCQKLSDVYKRHFRLATKEELRLAQQMNILLDYKKEKPELNANEDSRNEERDFRIVMDDITDADLDIGNATDASAITIKDLKKDKKDKPKRKGWRVLKGLAKSVLLPNIEE